MREASRGCGSYHRHRSHVSHCLGGTSTTLTDTTSSQPLKKIPSSRQQPRTTQAKNNQSKAHNSELRINLDHIRTIQNKGVGHIELVFHSRLGTHETICMHCIVLYVRELYLSVNCAMNGAVRDTRSGAVTRRSEGVVAVGRANDKCNAENIKKGTGQSFSQLWNHHHHHHRRDMNV